MKKSVSPLLLSNKSPHGSYTNQTPTGVLSHQAADNVKRLGKDNDLINRIRASTFFAPIQGELDSLLDPSTFIGRSPQQVEKFTSTEVKDAIRPYEKDLEKMETATLHV